MQTFDNRIVYLRLLASRWLWDIRQLYWMFTLSAPAAYHRKTYTVILKTNSSLKYAYSSIFIVVKSFTLKPVTFPQLKEREWKGKSKRDVSVRMHLTYTHTHTQDVPLWYPMAPLWIRLVICCSNGQAPPSCCQLLDWNGLLGFWLKLQTCSRSAVWTHTHTLLSGDRLSVWTHCNSLSDCLSIVFQRSHQEVPRHWPSQEVRQYEGEFQDQIIIGIRFQKCLLSQAILKHYMRTDTQY